MRALDNAIYASGAEQKGNEILITAKPGEHIIASVCLGASSAQKLHIIVNLAEGAKTTISGSCYAYKRAKHEISWAFAVGKNAELKMQEYQYWQENAEITEKKRISLGEGAKAEIETKVSENLGKGKIEIRADVGRGASYSSFYGGIAGEVELKETAELKEKAKAHIITRIACRTNAFARVESRLKGLGLCRGHVECDALLLGNASVQTIPALEINNEHAVLTHEAAIGKVSREELIYLMSKGLDEETAKRSLVEYFITP